MCGPAKRTFGISRQQLDAIRDWAENAQYVQEVRVFGSRAKGCARIDSDLDIAITATDGNYTRFDVDWKNALSEVTGLKVGLSQYNNSLNDAVQRYCADDSTILVYQRPRL